MPIYRATFTHTNGCHTHQVLTATEFHPAVAEAKRIAATRTGVRIANVSDEDGGTSASFPVSVSRSSGERDETKTIVEI